MEGGFGYKHAPSGIGTAEHHKRYMANLSLRPCGLGCQQLGLHHYAYSGHNSVRSYFASDRITSCSASLLRSQGDDDSPKPS